MALLLLKDPLKMTPPERLDALAEALAEGIIHLVDQGKLERFAAGDDIGELGDLALTSGRTEGIPSMDGRGKAHGG